MKDQTPRWRYESHWERGFEEPVEVHHFVHSDGRTMGLYETEDYLNLLETKLEESRAVNL